ncbi:Ion transport peptide, partial [Trachymyrmex cornetzi]
LIDFSVLDLCSNHRQDCFSTQYFTSCIQALLLEDEKERLQEMVEYLGRKK